MSKIDIARLVEASLRLSTTVDSGILFSKSSAILGLSCSDPYQSKSRDFYKYYNASFPMSPGSGSFSKNKSLRLVVQEGDKKEDLYWELWDSSRLLQVKDLKKIHTSLAGHAAFGRAAWSFDEKYVIYVAETISKKSASFWSGEEDIGNANLYKENFGEGLKHLSNPKLFLYNVQENSVKNIETGDGFYPGQAYFRPDSEDRKSVV